MKLYSAVRITKQGSTYHHSTPMLVADNGDTQSVGDFQWAEHRATIDALTEGKSTVQSTKGIGGHMEIGWRITRLPDYQTNRVLFDEHAKEHVMVSNGKCVSDHSSPGRYTATHAGNVCHYAPSEAIALRPLIDADGKVAIAWTYRKVNPCDLRPANDSARAAFAVAMHGSIVKRKGISQTFVGRI